MKKIVFLVNEDVVSAIKNRCNGRLMDRHLLFDAVFRKALNIPKESTPKQNIASIKHPESFKEWLYPKMGVPDRWYSRELYHEMNIEFPKLRISQKQMVLWIKSVAADAKKEVSFGKNAGGRFMVFSQKPDPNHH